MAETTEALNGSRLREELRHLGFVRRLVLVDQTGSTNDDVRRLADGDAVAGTVVVANEQTAGRGRMGRRWHSPRGTGLYISVLLRPQTPPDRVTRWTLAGAVAACEACHETAGSGKVAIRWPNDLFCNGRKLGGVLAELRTQAGSTHELVLGLGLNVGPLGDAAALPEQVASRATSLFDATGGRVVSREVLAKAYLERLAELTLALDHDEWSGIARRWERCAGDAHGAPVRVDGGESSFTGVTDGIDETGGLCVRTASGDRRVVRLTDAVVRLEESA